MIGWETEVLSVYPCQFPCNHSNPTISCDLLGSCIQSTLAITDLAIPDPLL